MTTGEPSRRLTVLVLASTYPRWRDDPEPGFVHALCRRLTSRFRVLALVPDAPGADPDGDMDGVDVVRYRYAPRALQTLVNDGGITSNLKRHPWKWLLVPGFVLGQYLAASRALKRRHVDVIHAHWLIPQGLIARLIGRRARIPFLVTAHGGDLFGLRGGMLEDEKRRVARASGMMTVVSSAMAREVERLRMRPPGLAVLPMGVDMTKRFVPEAGVERRASELLFVGRLVPKKGLVHLIDALPQVIEKHPDLRLRIAGFGPDEQMLKARALQLGLNDRITFMGAMSQDALPSLYRRAALFVAPFVRTQSGDQEGLPVVLMEAIGCGCPVVVGAVEGVSDLLGEQLASMSVPPGNVPALANAIVDVLDNPVSASERAEQVRLAARQRIDWQVIAAAYADLLERCARNGLP